jgi:hypothetical protein
MKPSVSSLLLGLAAATIPFAALRAEEAAATPQTPEEPCVTECEIVSPEPTVCPGPAPEICVLPVPEDKGGETTASPDEEAVEVTVTDVEGETAGTEEGGECEEVVCEVTVEDKSILYSTVGGVEVQRGEARGIDEAVMFKNDTATNQDSGAAATRGNAFGRDERGAEVQPAATQGGAKLDEIRKGPAAVVQKGRVFLR